MSVTGPLGCVLTDAAQFTGYYLNNATNPVFKIFGASAVNDNATLQLFTGGVNIIQLSVAGQTFFNTPIYLGNGASNAAPTAQTLLATGGLGTNIGGAALNISGVLAQEPAPVVPSCSPPRQPVAAARPRMEGSTVCSSTAQGFAPSATTPRCGSTAMSASTTPRRLPSRRSRARRDRMPRWRRS